MVLYNDHPFAVSQCVGHVTNFEIDMQEISHTCCNPERGGSGPSLDR
jgi:hypothetical protein